MRILHVLKARIFRGLVKRKLTACGSGLKVNGYSTVNGNIKVGNNVNFNGISIRGIGTVVIGDNFHSGVDCVILTSNHNYNGCKIPYDEKMIAKSVIIEDNVWIGDHVMILGDSVLREGCIIQAGSVVVGEIPSGAIAGGHPARVFKYRDMEKYNANKEKQEFL